MPEMPQLPPFDFAKRLYSAQHAYIGTIFSFLDEKSFQQRLEHVYAYPPDLTNRDDCLIYCQVLLVFAFGQMYSVNQYGEPLCKVLPRSCLNKHSFPFHDLCLIDY